jgi:hypothetical protein
MKDCLITSVPFELPYLSRIFVPEKIDAILRLNLNYRNIHQSGADRSDRKLLVWHNLSVSNRALPSRQNSELQSPEASPPSDKLDGGWMRKRNPPQRPCHANKPSAALPPPCLGVPLGSGPFLLPCERRSLPLLLVLRRRPLLLLFAPPPPTPSPGTLILFSPGLSVSSPRSSAPSTRGVC